MAGANPLEALPLTHHHGGHRGRGRWHAGPFQGAPGGPASGAYRSPTGSVIGSPATAMCSASRTATAAVPNGSDPATTPRNAKHPAGPCITSVIDQRAGQTLTEGIIIEDAVVPGAVAGLLPIELVGQAGRHWLRGRLPGGGPASALLSMFSGGRLGMTRHLQTFLVMGHDDQHGTVVMDGDQVRVEWPDAGTGEYYQRANDHLGRTSISGWWYVPAQPVVVEDSRPQPGDGAPPRRVRHGRRGRTGVVDDRGRVFASPTGTDVHEGLMIWDGSIVPRPLGVNPLLTISALAERGAALLVAEAGWEMDEVPATPLPATLRLSTRLEKLGLVLRLSAWWASGRRRLSLTTATWPAMKMWPCRVRPITPIFRLRAHAVD